MEAQFYSLTWNDLLVSLILIVLSVILIRWWKIGLEKTLLIGTLRTFLQLSVMGYVLTFFFQQRNWMFMVALLMVMILIASYEGTRRQKATNITNYFLILTGTLATAVIVVLGIILTFILEVEPWYYPYAMIPIGGMIIGNALNTTTLATNRFIGELKHRRNEIELLLSLGAPARAAVQEAIRDSVQAALIPSINAMMMVGLVQLPGVMTGQILAGVDPLIAIRYQIMIMYMWVTVGTIAIILTLALVYRQFFTPQVQLKTSLLGINNRR